MPRPDAEFDIDESLVRRLLEEQHPDLADGSLTHVADGWDNSNWRLVPARPSTGREPSSFTVRLPRRAQAADLVRSEQTWLNRISDPLPIAAPRVERIGEPSGDYPWPWSLCRWLDGEVLGAETLRPEDVIALADLLALLHRPAPPDAPANAYRGVAVSARRDAFDINLATASERGLLSPDHAAMVKGCFDADAATTWQGSPVWLHGDLHPRNVLMHEGRWVGLLDWGDLTSGDPASDLASAHMLVGARHREAFWARYRRQSHHGLTDDGFRGLRRRASAWAIYFGVLMLEAGTPDDPTFATVGRRILDELRR